MKRLIVVTALLILLVGCTCHYVEDAQLRDTLFSVERTESNAWRIWMTHDDLAGYCTLDEELGRKALSLLQEHDGEVVIVFRDISLLWGDEEYSWWDSSDCGNLYSGGGSAKWFLLLDLYPVSAR